MPPASTRIVFALAMLGSSASAQEASPASRPPAPRKIEDCAPPEEFVQVGAIKTHFVRKGDRGPAIVFVHGFGSNTYTWRENQKALAGEYRTYALDLKGFGITQKPKDGQYHLNAYADHLVGFLDAMKLDRAILVGNSMGGAVALQVALQHPERVRGLVLVDAAPLDVGRAASKDGKPLKDGPDGMNLSPGLLRFFMTRPMIEYGLKNSFRDPKIVTPEMIDAYYVPTTIEGAAEAFAAMAVMPPESAMPKLPPLSELKPRTLIVWGRNDKVLPIRLADQFAKSIPGSRKVILERSGHLPHEEEPAAFNTLIDEFARGLP